MYLPKKGVDLKFFTNELVYLNNDGDYKAGIKYKVAWKEYLEKHLPYIQRQNFAGNFHYLYNYHFHDCQLLKIIWQNDNKNVFMRIKDGLRELLDTNKGSVLNHEKVIGLKFINAHIIDSDIEIPFSRFMRKEIKYRYIYFNHDEVDIDLENKKCIYRFLFSAYLNIPNSHTQLINFDIEFDSIEIIY